MDGWSPRPRNASPPSGWLRLFDLQPLLRDAQWILVGGYREQRHGQPRMVTLSARGVEPPGGTLLEVLLPEATARNCLVRDADVPEGIYRVPARVVNREGRVRLVWVGEDLPRSRVQQAPALAEQRELLDDESAAAIDARYRDYVAALPGDRARPDVVPARFILLACRRLLQDAIAEIPIPPELPEYESLTAEDGDLDESEDSDSSFEPPLDPEERRRLQIRRDRRELFGMALAALVRNQTSAGLGVVLHALASIEDSSDPIARLREFASVLARAIGMDGVPLGRNRMESIGDESDVADPAPLP